MQDIFNLLVVTLMLVSPFIVLAIAYNSMVGRKPKQQAVPIDPMNAIMRMPLVHPTVGQRLQQEEAKLRSEFAGLQDVERMIDATYKKLYGRPK